MTKDMASESIDSLSAGGDANEQNQQLQIQLDDTQTESTYSSNVRVWNTPEEFNVDFGGALRPTGPASAVIKIQERIVLSPWAAKRLAIQIAQSVQKYEQTYGPIELDPRRRVVNSSK